MTTYVDSSALLKLYVDEPDSDDVQRILDADPVLVTAWISLVEVRRNLARLLAGASLARAREACERDFDAMALVSLDERGWRRAADIAEVLGVRSLDALHLATAQQLQIPDLIVCTFDLRQAHAARQLGLTVIGS
ncbi:MAG: type II toxin-antitoxin system VapC family toxin [Ilumatobacteraceae bacterium]